MIKQDKKALKLCACQEYDYRKEELPIKYSSLKGKIIDRDIVLDVYRDDTKEVFIHRFDTYLNSTKDLIEYYENLGLLHKIDVSNKNAETIFEEVKEILND